MLRWERCMSVGGDERRKDIQLFTRGCLPELPHIFISKVCTLQNIQKKMARIVGGSSRPLAVLESGMWSGFGVQQTSRER